MATTTTKKQQAARNSGNGTAKRATARKSSARARGETDTFTVPGMSESDADKVTETLQRRLEALIDLTLTLKHVHWNVVGNGFIGIHEMLDVQYTGVADMVDATAERIATLGGQPNGLAGSLVQHRSWDDYELGRAVVPQHLRGLDSAYRGVNSSHRDAIDAVGDLDPVTEDMLIGQLGQLEEYHWLIRAHLENADGVISLTGPSPK